MKLQDVLLKAMARTITWWEAAEIAGVSDRIIASWRKQLEEEGYKGLAVHHRGKTSFPLVPLRTVEEVMRLYQESNHHLSVRHFHERLRNEHGIRLSYDWVYHALVGAGLVQKGRVRVHQQLRKPPPLPGMLLQIRSSQYCWFNQDQWFDLLVILDDATSEIYYAQLVEEESTRTVMTAIRDVIKRRGLFRALYRDRRSHFSVTSKAAKVEKGLKQIKRALRELGVQMMPDQSPQAHGYADKSLGTWQRRLRQELRLRRIQTVEEANRFLGDHYIAQFNARFAMAATEKGTAFRRCKRKLDSIFTVQNERVVSRDNTVTIGERHWKLNKGRIGHALVGCRVTVHQHLDGRISIRFGPHALGSFGPHDGAV